MRRATLGGIAAAIVSLCLLLPGVAAAEPRVSYSAAEASAAEVRAYWTKERMENAIPLDAGLPTPEALPAPATLRDYANGAEKPYRVAATGPEARYAATPINDTTAPGTRTHGKIFASTPSFDYVCSGTVVTAQNQSTVWTAGHCIYDTDTNQFASFLLFVPAYNQGLKPFGEWAARTVAASQGWTQFGDQRDDVGAAVIEIKLRAKTAAEKQACNRFNKKRKRRRCKRKNVPAPIQDVVGSRGIAFNLDPAQTFAAFGYPVVPQPRFDGEHLELCISNLKTRDSNYPDPQPIGIECDMQGGSSGGGWVIPGAYVNGNVSYGYPTLDPNTAYSPYFDSLIAGFYNGVSDQ